MGIFRRAKRDWSVGPIAADPAAARHQGPRIDSLELIEEAIGRAGVDRGTVNMVEALTGVWGVRESIARDLFQQQRNQAAVDALAKVAERPDFTDDLFWDFLTHWGPQGIAVQRTVGERLCSEPVLEVFAAAARESWGFDLGGSQRI